MLVLAFKIAILIILVIVILAIFFGTLALIFNFISYCIDGLENMAEKVSQFIEKMAKTKPAKKLRQIKEKISYINNTKIAKNIVLGFYIFLLILGILFCIAMQYW